MIQVQTDHLKVVLS